MSRQFPGSGTSDYLVNTDDLGIDEPYTVAAWVRMDDVTSDSVIFGRYNTGSGNTWDSEILVEIADGTVSALKRNTDVVRAQTSNAMSDDTWHHVCAVFNADDDREMFLDGDAGNKGTDNTDVSDPTVNRNSIGQRTDSSPNGNCAGQIEHVCIWSVALSDSEIANLAAGDNPLTIQPGNIVAYWPLAGDDSPEPDVVGSADMTITGTVPQGANSAPVDDPPGSMAATEASDTFAATGVGSSDFPLIHEVVGTGNASPGETNEPADLPATEDGDLLLALLNVTAAATISNVDDTTGDSWTELDQQSPGGDVVGLFAKVADGDEGGEELNFDPAATPNASAVLVARVRFWRGTIADDIDLSTFNSGQSASPNTNQATAGWGADNNLFLSMIGAGNDDETMTSPPSGWGAPVNQVAGGGNNNGSTAALSALQSTNASEDPGAATLSDSEFWEGWTVVIRPAENTISGSLAATEAADTFAGAGDVTVQGDLAVTEAVDAFAGSGDVDVQGDLAATEAADTMAATGTTALFGDLVATEAVDAFTGAGDVLVEGDLAATEAADTFAASGDVDVQGDLAATEAADAFAGAGDVLVEGDLAATEAADAMSFAGISIDVSGDMAAVEAPDTINVVIGQWYYRLYTPTTDGRDLTVTNGRTYDTITITRPIR